MLDVETAILKKKSCYLRIKECAAPWNLADCSPQALCIPFVALTKQIPCSLSISPPHPPPVGTPTLPHLVGVVGDVVRVVSGGLVLEGLLVNILNVRFLGLDLLHKTLNLQVYCTLCLSDLVSIIDKCAGVPYT